MKNTEGPPFMWIHFTTNSHGYSLFSYQVPASNSKTKKKNSSGIPFP